MSERILEVGNLTVDIPVGNGMLHAVQGISFHVDKGETLCIVGESGCGKSLTSLAIMDLLPSKAIRNANTLELDGEDILNASERRMSDIRGNTMGMIFQEPMTSLNPAFTIGNQMEEILKRHRKVSTTEARDRAIYLLEKVGITAAASRLSQYPHQLSGGLRQRVMIAMTLMCGPDLIIADEPTTALDVTIQAQILLLLAELQREFESPMTWAWSRGSQIVSPSCMPAKWSKKALPIKCSTDRRIRIPRACWSAFPSPARPSAANRWARSPASCRHWLVGSRPATSQTAVHS